MSKQPFILTPIYPATSADLKRIYAPRQRKVLPKRWNSEWPPRGMIGVILRLYDFSNVPEDGLEGPDQFGRYHVTRTDIVKDEWQPFAPFVARKHFVPFHVDMIPATSWGASLANLLSQHSWKQVRREVFQRAGYVCEICGQADGPVECHELWAFDDQNTVDGWNTQTLQSLMCLCHDCHEMFHPGLADLNGRAKECSDRRKAVNAWTKKDHDIAVAQMMKKFEQRSNKRWRLDLSSLPQNLTLEIKLGWRRMNKDTDVLLNLEKQSRTRIMGAKYKLLDPVTMDYFPPF